MRNAFAKGKGKRAGPSFDTTRSGLKDQICGGVKSHNFEPKEDPWLGGRTDCVNVLNGAVPKLQKCPEA
jgi:hypothetical protein